MKLLCPHYSSTFVTKNIYTWKTPKYMCFHGGQIPKLDIEKLTLIDFTFSEVEGELWNPSREVFHQNYSSGRVLVRFSVTFRGAFVRSP